MSFPPIDSNSSSSSITSLRFSIAAARTHVQNGEALDAVVHYIAVLKSLSHDGRRQFAGEFLKALQAYLKWERSAGKAREVLAVSSNLYTSEYGVWRVWAEWLFEQGDLLNSLETYRRAKQTARNDLEWLHASVCCDNLQSQLVEQWHWRMVNDGKRNWAFCTAIQRALEHVRDRIGSIGPIRMLEIGCGSGLLSIFASKLPGFPQLSIGMCELDEVMQRVAEATISTNKCSSGYIQLHKMHSSRMEPPPGEGKRYNLLVTETLDCGIFGEHILSTVLDAKQRLLTSDAVIVPQGAIAVFALLESVDIAEENWYACESSDYAIVSQSCNTPAQAPFTTSVGIEDQLPPSPYTCLFIGQQLPQGHRLLSNRTEALLVDFNNEAQLRHLLSNQFRSQLVLEATEDGVVHALVQWFHVRIFEDIELCTAPEEETCWQQSIFPLYPPLAVKKGTKLRFELVVHDEKLYIRSLNAPRLHVPEPNGPSPRQPLRAPADFDHLASNDPRVGDFYREVISSKQAAICRRPGCTTPKFHLVDCSDLLLSDRLARSTKGDSSIPQAWEIASDKAVIRYAANHKAGNMHQAPLAPLPTAKQAAANGGQQQRNTLILHWPFNSKGLLLDDYLASVLEIRLRSHPAAQLVPSMISMRACLIHSPELLSISRLVPAGGRKSENDVHCGVELSAMDEYRLHYFHEIDRGQLAHEQLSQEVEMFRMCFRNVATDLEQLTKLRCECELQCIRKNMGQQNLRNSSSGDGRGSVECNAILYWFECSSPENADMADKQIMGDSKATAMKLDLSRCSGARTSAYIFPENRRIPEGEGLKVEVSLHHGNVVFHQVRSTVFL